MTLSEEQLIVLQDTLDDRIKYNETFDEVYDHVLTALEHVDNNVSLGQAINTIMLNDFGGFKGLRKIERKRWWTVARQMVGKQLWFFIDCLKFPLLPAIAIFSVIIYYCITQFETDYMTINVYFIYTSSIAIYPFCGVYFHLTTGYRLKVIRKSIKFQPLQMISCLPFFLFIGGHLIISFISREIISGPDIFSRFSLPPTAISLLLTLYIVYLISFFRLFNYEIPQFEIK